MDNSNCFETVSPNYKSAVIPTIIFPLCLFTLIVIPIMFNTKYNLWVIAIVFLVAVICIVWSAIESMKMRIVQIEVDKIKYSEEILQASDIKEIVFYGQSIDIRIKHGNMYARIIRFQLIDKQLLNIIKAELDDFARDNKIKIKSTYY